MWRRLNVLPLMLIVVLPALVFVAPTVAAPDSRHFSLPQFDVDVTYPATVKPGDIVTVTATAVSKSSTYILDLTVEILVPSANGEMRSLLSLSLAKETSTYSGSRYSRTGSATIPMDVPRSFMMAMVSQNVREYHYSYYYAPYYYPYSYSWSNTSHYRYWWPVYYTYRTYSDSVDVGMAPLSYVLAPTPEYNQLKSDYDKLQSNYDKLSGDHSTLSNQFTTLRNQYDNLVLENQNLSQLLALARIALLSIVVGIVIIVVLLSLQRQGRIVIKSPVLIKKKE